MPLDELLFEHIRLKKSMVWYVSFDFHYLEPRVFTKGRYKKAYFIWRKKEQALYTNQRKRLFSLLLRENFSRASWFGSDKSTHTSSADQTWVITWKIIGDSSWSDKRGGDGLWSNRSGDDGSWSGSLNHFSGKNQIGFSRYDL